MKQNIIKNVILTDLRNGKLKPGDELVSQRKLAKKYNVGMSIVREALAALSILNLIEVKPGKGAYVSSISPKALISPLKNKIYLSKNEILEFYNLRKTLDSEAITEVIEKTSEKDIKKLEVPINKMKSLINQNNDNILKFVAEDVKFHKMLYKLTNNYILILTNNFFYENFVENLGVYFSINHNQLSELFDLHVRVYNAIKERDIEGSKYHYKKIINIAIDNIEIMIK